MPSRVSGECLTAFSELGFILSTFRSKTFFDRIDFASSYWGYTHKGSRPPSPFRRTFATATRYDARTCNAELDVLTADNALTVRVTNALYKKFSDKLGDNSSFGASLTAELNQTVDLIAGTTLRLYQAARLVRKFDFQGAARILGLPYFERTRKKVFYTRLTAKTRGRRIVQRERVFTLPTGREVLKTLSNGWLMWSYGVKPLAQDISNALETLNKPLALDEKIVASAFSSATRTASAGGPPSTTDPTVTVHSGSVRGSCGAWVSVSNPNAHLLNKFGLTNPAEWVLEAIPFSFVIDWFSNLSVVVGSLTNYIGLTIKNPWLSLQFKASRSWFNLASGNYYFFDSFVFQRTLGLPEPKLRFEYERFQPQRALNAIALLVGFLPRTR